MNFHLSSITKQTVALKEIRLQPEEGAPFTAIREGNMTNINHSDVLVSFFVN